ncbi:MAG TPA: pitrilysin family protein [Chloroflexota bacterium]
MTAAATPTAVQYDRHRLDNGLRIVACQLQDTRAASARVFLDGGARVEPDDVAGVAHFLEHAVFKGTERWPTARELGLATERFGGAADAFTDKDHSGFVVHGPADHLPLFLDVLADLVQRPVLRPEDVERERAVIAEELRAYRDDSDDVAKTTLERSLWPRHPLGREIVGTSATIRRMTRDDLEAHRGRSFTPRGAVVSVASSWPTARVFDEVGRAFADWRGDDPPRGRPAPPPPGGPLISLQGRRAEQVRFRIGFPAPSRHEPHRHGLDILATSLAGPATSRLELRLREELALVYDVSVSLEQYDDTGLISVAAGVVGDKLAQALRATVAELRDVRAGLPADELSRVRDYLIGRWLCAEGTDFHASFAGRDEQVFGRPMSIEEEIASLRAVTLDEVRGLAERLFRPERALLAVVGPYHHSATIHRILSGL